MQGIKLSKSKTLKSNCAQTMSMVTAQLFPKICAQTSCLFGICARTSTALVGSQPGGVFNWTNIFDHFT